MAELNHHRGLPTQALILALVAVLVIPGIIFTGFVLARYAESERMRHFAEARDTARYVAGVIDRDINGIANTLQTLSTSHYLLTGDLEGFYRQAAGVKAYIDADIGLRLPTGQQLVNTRVPWGTVLPSTPISLDAEAISTRKPAISDIFTGAIANRPLFAIIWPVIIDDEVKYLLHVSAETDRIANVIQSIVSPEWLIGVGDRNGIYVARSRNHAEFNGKPGVPAFLARATGDTGTFVSEDPFGNAILVGYTRSALTQWLIAASVPQSQIEGPMRNALWILTGFGALALFIASLIALWLWRFIARPLDALAAASRRIGQRGADFDIKTPLREFSAVSAALSAAARDVRTTNDALEATVAARTRELEQANVELKGQMAAREVAEGQVRQMQKMEAVGQLTGGIAHDFNNMLSIVTSALGLLQRRLERGEMNVKKYVDAAVEGTERAAALTRRLLAFSRQQPLAPQMVEINRLVAGMSELLQRTLGETIRIETVLAAGLWRTYADASQIENAILNLAVNARDAMPDGGRLTIETANTFLDETYALDNEGLASGQYVLVAVTDTGSGMPPDVMLRAFDPFFTTKNVGMGTGLGLSQVYGFVKQSAGHIKIYSEPGQGTTIKIYLPRYYGNVDSVPTAQPARPLPAGNSKEIILVVEDEERLRQMTVDTLVDLGYTVFAAGHATEALAIIDQHPEITLLFTDIMMPDINGRKLADEAVRRMPGLQVLFTTGFTRNAVVHNGVLDAGVNFLPKPFTMEELAEKIRQILGHPSADSVNPTECPP